MPALVSSQVFIPEPGRRYHFHTLSDGRVYGWWERVTPEGQPVPMEESAWVQLTPALPAEVLGGTPSSDRSNG
jgi:hypothetical protein